MGRTLVVVAVLSSFALTACRESPERLEVGANPSLAEHSAEFAKDVIKVTDGVHVAVGFGIANSVLIEGDDGVIVVDTLESAEAAQPVKEAFARITAKPVKAIIYTHNHGDHVFGAKVFAGDDKPEIYSHASTLYYLDRVVTVVRPIIFMRSMRQFGTYLPQSAVLNVGIGPRLFISNETTPALLRPTRTFPGEKLELEVAGVKMELVHAPGETNDQIFVWIPEKRVLLCGDNYYKSFPNLYAIRGTPYREVAQWIESLDKMRALRPEYLVPGHTRPLSGAARIYTVLTNYRDAIQFVHDQTIRGMNQGLTPDELVERVKLPPHLARLPYLQEYYGTVEWAVRAIFAGYLGWFSGNATDLFPLPPRAHAERFVRLGGGRDALVEKARRAVASGDYQWGLELAGQLLALEPDLAAAREVRADALSALGARQISANARHYYLTQALEARNQIRIAPADPSRLPPDLIHSFPLRGIFASLAVNLDPQRSADTDTVAGFRFPDSGEAFTVHVRRGVAEVQPRFPAAPDISVTVPSTVWKEIAAGTRSALVAYARGQIEIEGNIVKLVEFLRLFRRG